MTAQERFTLLTRLQIEHPREADLIARIGQEIGDAIRAGDEQRAENWRQMIGEVERLGGKPS